jgi:uncharacterized protein
VLDQVTGGHRHHLRRPDGENTARGRRKASARILIAGGPRSGKTALIEAASHIEPLSFESTAALPLAAEAPAETIEFGRITVARSPILDLWLVGTRGHQRCWSVWDVLRREATTLIGAVVLVDARRLADCVPSLDYLERHRVPYLLMVNQFDETSLVDAAKLRATLAIDQSTPVVCGDSRRPEDARDVLIQLVEHALGVPGPRPWDG